MEIDNLLKDEFPVKWLDTKVWIRIHDGEPQVISVQPNIGFNGEVDPQTVVLIIDEEIAIANRFDVAKMLVAQNCVPLERMLHWKHLIQH